jgi:DnaK suppressor protein
MRKTDRERYRAKLQARLDELVRAGLQNLRDHRDVTRDPPGDEVDEAQRILAADTEIALSERELLVAQQIEAALERIDAGQFGRCIDCDEPIERERLDAVPWAVRCTIDQEEFEHSRGEPFPSTL